MTKRPDFSALFTASPYPYLLVDTDFSIIGANPSYLQATGRTADDIVGKHIFDAFPSNPADPDSTNLDEVRLSIERAIATRAPHTSALLRYAVPRETPEGRVFDERYWSAVHTPVFDDSGVVAFVAQNAIDVTDLYRFDGATNKYYLKQDANAVPDIPQTSRPQMHEAMTRIVNAERSQLQTLFNQAPGFIAVLTGPDHRFEMANEAYYQLVGYRDIVGKPAMEALPELASQGFNELLDSAMRPASRWCYASARLRCSANAAVRPKTGMLTCFVNRSGGRTGGSREFLHRAMTLPARIGPTGHYRKRYSSSKKQNQARRSSSSWRIAFASWTILTRSPRPHARCWAGN
jgi:PAS domain S-box-containing protein